MQINHVDIDSLKYLLFNTSILVGLLTLFTYVLNTTGILSLSFPRFILTTTILVLIILSNLIVRILIAKWRGCVYSYEHSLPISFLSAILAARTLGALPTLYTGGSKLTENPIERVGYATTAVSQEELSLVARIPLTLNLITTLFLLLTQLVTTTLFFYTALLLTTYTLLSLIPYPFSNGMHILSYNGSQWKRYVYTTLILLVATLIFGNI